jgi:hypothetical protein
MASAKRKPTSLNDLLEILSMNLAQLNDAGLTINTEWADGVATLRLHGVAEAHDAEGMYYVPYTAPASPETSAQPGVYAVKGD